MIFLLFVVLFPPGCFVRRKRRVFSWGSRRMRREQIRACAQTWGYTLGNCARLSVWILAARLSSDCAGNGDSLVSAARVVEYEGRDSWISAWTGNSRGPHGTARLQRERGEEGSREEKPLERNLVLPTATCQEWGASTFPIGQPTPQPHSSQTNDLWLRPPSTEEPRSQTRQPKVNHPAPDSPRCPSSLAHPFHSSNSILLVCVLWWDGNDESPLQGTPTPFSKFWDLCTPSPIRRWACACIFAPRSALGCATIDEKACRSRLMYPRITILSIFLVFPTGPINQPPLDFYSASTALEEWETLC